MLEILHRLHHVSPELEPYAADMVDVLLDLIRIEDEDNAVLCLKTIMDLARNQPKPTAPKVQAFLDLILEMFEMMEGVVKDTFDKDSSQPAGLPSTPSAPTFQSPRPGSPATTISDSGVERKDPELVKGMQSFKVLSECPIIVVSIFQAHRPSVAANVKKFVPSIKGILMLQAKAQEKAHTDAAAAGTIFTGVTKDIKNRAAFGDFITAQVKTMSFLAYLLRVYANQLSDFLPTLPGVVVRLLKDCPREKSGARKELLVAIRHIINFNYRKIFLDKLDDLLDERILIGDGLTVYETMRPLAYSMLADLIHHVREKLNRDQFRKTIEVYTRNLHDNFPGTSFQTMSAKLLLNMAESITKLENKEDARYFLIMILDAIGDKFAAMNYQYDNAVKLSKEYSTKPSESTLSAQYMDDKDVIPDWDEIDIFTATPIKTSNPRDRGADPVADNKFLFKNLVNGLKNMFFQLKTCNPTNIAIEPSITPVNWGEVSFGYSAEEVKVIAKLFHEGARVFKYYGVEAQSQNDQYSSPVEFMASHQMAQMSREEKELLESFGTVFHCVDPATFHEIFQAEIPYLHDLMLEHTALLHLPQFFLASEATSPAFAGMVLQYLMDRIEEVGSSDVIKSSILLRMFKLSFMAVTLFSVQNEQVLLPHVTTIVTKCIQLSVTAEEPLNYFILLRSLFRSIGGGRFELLYKEILPLLEMLLETFNHLLQGARKASERDLYVELTLTVPARLSHLLPHLSHLMRPLVVALRAGSDLVGQGLRTLELCVDNLTADYLDPIMAPIMDDLMTALFEHLRPLPYSHFHAHTTMRILGKLGGRNRRFLNHPHSLNYKPYADDDPSFDIRLLGSAKDRAFPLDTGVDLALSRLQEPPSKSSNIKSLDQHYKLQSFKYIMTQVKLLIGSDHLPEDLATLIRMQANDLAAHRVETYAKDDDKDDLDASMEKRDAQEAVLKKLLNGCILATTIPELQAHADVFLQSVYRTFAIVDLGQALADAGMKAKEFDVSDGEGYVTLSTNVFADVLIDSWASDNIELHQAAEKAMICFSDAARAIFGSSDFIDHLPFFKFLAKTLCFKCRQLEWFNKAGAVLGIQFMTTKLGLSDNIFASRQSDFLKSLLFVIKDTPPDLPAHTRLVAQATLQEIVRQSCQRNKGNKANYDNLCSIFIIELCHMNKFVREAAKAAFVTIAEESETEVHDLISPIKDRLLQPIFNKPLRALPFLTQIGFIDAITYLLQLGHDTIPLNDQLNRLIMESLALADAENEVLHPKPDDFNNAELIVDLRVACLKLLSTMMSIAEFSNPPHNASRPRIISVFFKSLYAKAPDIIDAANNGLRDVLTQTNKLPKDLLQNGLRPILMNLQDPKRLTVAGLEGLARLLNLLTNYFKVEIGARLLEHMKAIAEDQVLQRVSFGLIEQVPQMKIVAAILNVFHLLPSAATTFMGELINGVIDIESKLRRTSSSPFRKPLVKYLTRYPKETWSFFLDKIQEEKYGRLFAQILSDPISDKLREVAIAESEALFSAVFEIESTQTRSIANINGIAIVHAVVSHEPTKDWLSRQPQLKSHLMVTAKDLEQKLRKDQMLLSQRLRAQQAEEQVVDVITSYLRHFPDDYDFAFEFFSASALGDIKRPLTLQKFLFADIIDSDNVEYRRALIERSLEVYSQKIVPQKVKTFVLHQLTNPILARDIQKCRQNAEALPVMDKSMCDLVHNRLWKPQTVELAEETTLQGIDHTRMEALQLSALLIKYHKDIVSEARKEIIKFAWSYIRLEDVINKYAAYVMISYFIRSYETPAKITQQIYMALLKAHQNEGRSLVTQALEILAPILPSRLVQPGAQQDPRIPLWVRFPKRILGEESGNLQQVQSIFYFLVRQPDLFFESREFFISNIVQMLPKIASPPNPSNESKKLALSLITLIWRWETKRIENNSSTQNDPESPSKKRDASGQSLGPPSAKEKSEYMIPLDLRRSVVKYLITFITSLQERFPVPAAELKARTAQKSAYQGISNEMCKKAVQLLEDLLSPELWSDVDVDLYEKLLDPILAGEKAEKPDEKHTTTMINALQVMRILLANKSKDWMLSKIETIQKLLEKPLRLEDPEIQDCMHVLESKDGQSTALPLLRLVFEAIPEDRPEEDDAMEVDSPGAEFVKNYGTITTEALNAGNLVSSINCLWTMSKVRPDMVDTHFAMIMKHFSQRLVKDHVNAFAQAPAQGQGMRPPDANSDPVDFFLGVDLIQKTIDVLSTRMSTLGDQRRPFLSVLATIVEKSMNADLCNKILDMVETWIFESGETWPTLKEKVAVLHKMLLFENRPDQTLLKRFLDLVIRIYEDETITRSELTVRLEHAFLIGTRAKDVDMRARFMAIFNKSLSQTASSRLSYVLTSQNWDTLADSFWLKQATQLLFGSIDMNMPIRLHQDDYRICAPSQLFSRPSINPEQNADDIMIDDELESLVLAQRKFNQDISEMKSRDLLEPLVQLQHIDDSVAYDVWVKLFPLFWSAQSRDERIDLEKGMVTLLTREYHQRQLNLRPNVIQALVEGAVRAAPRFKIPPHVLKFLSRTYDAWYTSLVSLEESAINPLIDTPAVRESNLDALVEIYSGLQEDDLFYGAWRRRCKFMETNAALSYEQHGMWDRALHLWEAAQVKARVGNVPFSQGEYALWEDHWLLCAQKLQHWEILNEFAKHENYNDLLLEAVWRSHDTWVGDENRNSLETMVKSVSDAPTPRRTFFQAFMSLLRYGAKQQPRAEFAHICDEAVQLSIRKWHQLPSKITNAHIPILQNFQQLVELHDASVICDSLNGTNERNLDTKSQEVKLLLQAWRDRLPNIWDDVNAWQELVTWRQHVFTLVNTTYLPLLPQGNNNVGNNSYAFRGYHETAWIINKFAHVARKHQMPDVCIQQLGKIYTLPNIEIQEAFLKLREQAKCHYQNRAELNNGLDVINNTNLNYFGAQQKAEFYTLKGMFLAKLAHQEEANEAFGIALYYDLRLPKAWAEWGQYSDRRFKDDPTNLDLAHNAVSCYLEAAGLYKSGKSRKMLSRVLWLLSLDNEEGAISKAFDEFKGDSPIWYWTTFIPQLLGSLEHKEARLAKIVLSKIAKMYPQALFYQLRTTREELTAKKKQHDQRQAKNQQQSPAQSKTPASNSSRPGTANGEQPIVNGDEGSPKPKQEPNGDTQVQDAKPPEKETPKKPWEYADEIMAGLKTAFPLLALSMETMTDQIVKYFKCPPDEDAYRLIVALLNDALSYVSRPSVTVNQDTKLPPQTENNIAKFAESVLPSHIRKSFEVDFVSKPPTMLEYIQKLRRWRDKFEHKLDHRENWKPLDSYGQQHLSEFKFLKFDESVEVPGQYQQHKDKNNDFIRIERFMPKVDLVRGNGVCWRRLTIRGHDGSLHPFAVQHPAGRHVRREERIVQLFRIFNGILAKRKESRRRNLSFHLPFLVPIAPHIRLVQDDSSYITIQGVFEDHCRRVGMNRDEPVLFALKRLREIAETLKQSSPPRSSEQQQIMRTETFTSLQDRWVPHTLVLDYFKQIYPNFEDFWLFRRQFSYQFAAGTFLTYVMHMANRFPSKIAIARSTGDVWMSELVPSLNPAKAHFFTSEHVAIRITPNLQTLMGPIALEGIFTASLMAIARCLTEPSDGYEMEQQLSIFVRDEMVHWAISNNKGGMPGIEPQLREMVEMNTSHVVKRALNLARTPAALQLSLQQQIQLQQLQQIQREQQHAQQQQQNGTNANGASGSSDADAARERERTAREAAQAAATAAAQAAANAQGQPAAGLPACQSVVDLISKSTDPNKLALMDPLWMAWL